jgi:trehalose 6-phosphate phosphatase
LARTALLLDFDGTLVDFAPRPELITVPDGMTASLRALRPLLGDALAIITGRTIAEIESFLPGLPQAIAGEHGGAFKTAPGRAIERLRVTPMPSHWRPHVLAIADAHAGVALEEKAHSLVLHFRQAPQAGPALEAAVRALVGGNDDYHVMPSAFAWEIKPKGIDKGGAVRALMRNPPFQGRLPLFIGDDVTDRDGIAAARALGGEGLLVGDHFGDPSGVRRWLTASAASGEWASN